MDVWTLIDALVLGLVEGLTEFIPVSSTGHILLLGHFLGFESTGKSFEVLIQLGAILAILTVYFRRFWAIALALPSNPRARRFAYGIALAFLPAAVLGVALHGIIKTVLFDSPALICTTLLIGGIVLLVVDRLPLQPKRRSAYDLSPRVALGIGICQTVALIPGVSRSGATIVGAMLLGVEKRAAAEFSFFLAVPTMVGAFGYDLYKNVGRLSSDDAVAIVIGFVASFLVAWAVIRRLLAFVSSHGYAPFGWWRIAVAIAGFVALIATGELDPMAPFRSAEAPVAGDGGRLVTTTTIRVDNPVGDLPIGAPEPGAAGAAPADGGPVQPLPAAGSVEPPPPPSLPGADTGPAMPGPGGAAAEPASPLLPPSTLPATTPPPPTLPPSTLPAATPATPAPAAPAMPGDGASGAAPGFFDDRFSVVPPTAPAQ